MTTLKQPSMQKDYAKKYRNSLKRGSAPSVGLAWGFVLGFVAWGFIFAIAKAVGA